MHLSHTPPTKELTKEILSQPWVACDTEFDGPRVLKNPSQKKSSTNKEMPDQLKATLVGFSLWYPGCPWPEGMYFPMGPEDPDEFTGRSYVSMWLFQFMDKYQGVVYFHNGMADLTVMNNPVNCVLFPRNVGDTMHLAWLLNRRPPGSKKGLSLDALIRKDLGVEGGKSFHDTFQGRRASEVPAEEMAPYAAKDAWYTGRLTEIYLRELGKDSKRLTLAEDVEGPLVPVVTRMYQTGVRLDTEAVAEADKEINDQLQPILEEFRRLTECCVLMPFKERRETGEFFKNGNPKKKTVEVMRPVILGADALNDGQVRRWLYHELKWWPTEGTNTTGSGLLSVAADDVTKYLTLEDPLARRAAELRLQAKKLSKLHSTYVRPFPHYAQKHRDGRIHPNWHATGTETARFSSSGPNLQNIPRPSEDYLGLTMPNLRKVFIPDEGYVMLGCDYSQLELRIMAHLSQDENLCKAFNEGLDPHQMTIDGLREGYGIELDRPKAKICNFSIIYKISAWSLGEKLGLPKEKAADIIRGFYKQYPGIKEFQDRCIAYGRKHNAMPGLGGFLRQLDYPVEKCTKGGQWCSCKACKATYREDKTAVNSVVQSTGGVIMRRAMVSLGKAWKHTNRRILLQVHDELLCEVPEDEADTGLQELQWHMENAMKLRVPLVAEPSKGMNWFECK